jgi:PAS domain S-box-containing protein
LRHSRLDKQKAEELERYRLVLENFPVGIFTCDLEGNVTSLNKVVLRYGYKREEVIGKSLLEFIPEKHWPMISEYLTDLAEGKSVQGELELITKKGMMVAEFRSSPIRRRGKIVGFQSILIDLTERKKTEEKLRESEERFRNLYESIQEPVAIYVGREGRLVDYNTAFKKLTGYTDEELKDKTFLDLTHPDDRAMVLGKYRTDYPEEKLPIVYEVRGVNKKGETEYLEVSVSAYRKKGKVIGIEAISRVITERKKMEEDLRESEERFRDLYESIPDALAVYVGRDGRLIEYNTAFKIHYGYTDEELKDKTFLDFVHPDDRAMVLGKYRTDYPEEKLPIVYEVRGVNKKGEVIPIEISVGPYKKKGKIIGINVIHRDITERKEMEEKLRESEQRFRDLYESIQDPVGIFVGREGRLVDYNTAFKKSAGYTDEELKDKTFLDFVHPDDRAMVLGKYRTDYPEEKLPLVYEIRGVNKKGEVNPLEISVSTYKKKGRVIGIEVIHRDITGRKAMEKKLQEYAEHLGEMVEERTKELKESQERLIKSERLAAIGQLAAMVGHDLRNPLTGIAGAAYYLRTKLSSKMDRTTREMLEVIEKDVKYSDKIIGDLLEYSRDVRLDLAETTPKSILKDALTLVKVPKSVQISDSTENEPEIKIDAEKMKRVFVNIIKNAIDAMPKGGTLTIKSKETNGNVEIAFTDSGAGMSKETIEKLWTPLFTTKARGIGLGLSICKRIVEAHGGEILVESAIGAGTTFTIAIPFKPKSERGEKIWVDVPKPLWSSMTKS